MSIIPRAPELESKVSRAHLYRDTRTTSQQFFQSLPDASTAVMVTVIAALIGYAIPATFPLAVLVMLVVLGIVYRKKTNATLPMRLPAHLGPRTDFNRVSVTGKYEKAAGTIYLGNMRRGRKQLWANGNDILTHSLVLGASGAGKTETLLSLSTTSAFCMGGGLMYVDAKASVGLLLQFWTLAVMFGRVDDVRIINYQTGGEPIKERDWRRRTNTSNPFAQGTAIQASNTLIGLLPGGSGDNQYFLDRAIAILQTLMPALVELRDKGVLNIYPSLLSKYINLQKFVELSNNVIIVPGDDTDYGHISLSNRVLEPLNAFLAALPGYDPAMPAGEQPEEVKRQFGFAEGFYSRALTNLAGQFAHIYQTELGEADYRDVVMNNRILIVAIPGIETMPEETQALGKVVLAAIRTAVSAGLGALSEGDRSDIQDALPIDLVVPTVLIVDEYAEVAISGMATLITQARGLGTSVVISNQDLAGIKKANAIEAQQIFGSTNIKYLMKMMDTEETWKAFREYAGTMKVAQSSGWDRNEDALVSPYKQTWSANIHEADRVNIDDLKAQTEGQAHVFQGADIHRIDTFYHGLAKKDLVQNYRYNRMLKVRPLSLDLVRQLKRQVLLGRSLEDTLRGDQPSGMNLGAYSNHVTTFIDRATALADNQAWPLASIERDMLQTFAQSSTANTEEDPAPADPEETNPTGDTDQPTIPATNQKQDAAAEPETGAAPNPQLTELLQGMIGSPSEESSINPPSSPEPAPAPEQPAAPTSDTETDSQDQEIPNRRNADALQWAFSYESSGLPIGTTRQLLEAFTNIATATGAASDDAAEFAKDIVDAVADAVDYPSEPMVKTRVKESQKIIDWLRNT